MHIPDGYLSPSTCAVLYGGAGAGWYVSLRRMKRNLNARMVPLISVFAAFSFVVMLFNLPLPGGTTGHALGVTIAAIVLGPSGAILATSLAIAIQALFFGDGGITTLGANCFNMAVVGSLVAYATYRAISANAALTSRRRVVAAAIAGYIAVNASALAHGRGIRHPADAISRRSGCSSVRAVFARRRRSGHDDWSLGGRRGRRGGNFRWSGRLSSESPILRCCGRPRDWPTTPIHCNLRRLVRYAGSGSRLRSSCC